MWTPCSRRPSASERSRTPLRSRSCAFNSWTGAGISASDSSTPGSGVVATTSTVIETAGGPAWANVTAGHPHAATATIRRRRLMPFMPLVCIAETRSCPPIICDLGPTSKSPRADTHPISEQDFRNSSGNRQTWRCYNLNRFLIFRGVDLMQRTAVALFVWLVLAAGLAAQSFSLSGRVVDPQGGVVVNAAVALTGAGVPRRTARTGADGTFAFDNLAPGHYVVSVDSPGFVAWTQDVTVGANASPLSVTLQIAGFV